MGRYPLLLLTLLLCSATAAPDSPHPLESLFEPGNPAFGLHPLTRAQVARLSRDARLRARGFDPDSHVEPPRRELDLVQENATRESLFAGFDYEGRLEAKRRALLEAARRQPLDRLVRLLDHALLEEPLAFLRRHAALTRGLERGGKTTTHALLALRQSERQFHELFAHELGLRIRESTSRGKALDELERRLRSGGVAQRRLAAIAAAAAGAGRMLERAAATEEEALVLEALLEGVRGADPQRAEKFFPLWAGDPREAMRHAALRACARIDEGWSRDLLASLLGRAAGASRDHLERILGREGSGDIEFWGIRTHSRRILFCIDTSRSMSFPIDGAGGRGEPRIHRTRRYLSQTLQALPEDARFDILLFGAPVRFRNRLVNATPDEKSAALAFLDAAVVDGGTNLGAALDAALGSGADTLFLLTDGEPSTGLLVDPAHLLAETIARNADGHLTIHCIGLGRDQNAELLANLAARGQGRWVEER